MPPELLRSLQDYIDRMPFARPFHFKVEEARRGFVRVTLQPQEKFFNHFGTYQAGVLCTLAEITGGSLCGTFHDLAKNFMITKLTQVKFERATHRALTAEASLHEPAVRQALADLERQRKIDLPVNVQIKAAEEGPIATSQSVYYLRLGFPGHFQSQSKWVTSIKLCKLL